MSQKKKRHDEEKAQEEVTQQASDTPEEAGSTETDELEAAKAEAAEYKDKYLRAHADFENTKKRLEREKANAVAFANESFAKDLLAVLDSFDNALASIESASEENCSEVLDKMREGVRLTYEQLKKVMEKNHIKEIACDTEFDPQVHQAVMQVDSDEHESGQIVQVLQKGYMMKDRVLRPAMVSTCK